MLSQLLSIQEASPGWFPRYQQEPGLQIQIQAMSQARAQKPTRQGVEEAARSCDVAEFLRAPRLARERRMSFFF